MLGCQQMTSSSMMVVVCAVCRWKASKKPRRKRSIRWENVVFTQQRNVVCNVDCTPSRRLNGNASHFLQIYILSSSFAAMANLSVVVHLRFCIDSTASRKETGFSRRWIVNCVHCFMVRLWALNVQLSNRWLKIKRDFFVWRFVNRNRMVYDVNERSRSFLGQDIITLQWCAIKLK